MRKLVAFVCVWATFFMFASFAFAQDYTPLAPLPGTYTGPAGAETTNLSLYLSGMLKLLIALGAMFSILVAVIGGTQYVASGIAPSAKQDAKDRILNALIGLTLVLTSYLILNSINPKLVAFNFMLPPIGTSPMATTPITPIQTYPITASVGVGGAIFPSGIKNIAQGSSQQYSIAPSVGYHIATLVVDSVQVANSTLYTFSNTQAGHTISATFAPNPVPPGSNIITSNTGPGGTIFPIGMEIIAVGASKTYTVTPNSGYYIATLVVDGASIATSTSYTFNNVTSSHTISATFVSPYIPPARLDPSNDYSIITHCIGNTTYYLCLKTDLNNDGITNTADVTLFRMRGGNLNVNQNTTLELADVVPAGAQSCFLKTATANVHPILPHYRRDGTGTPAVFKTFCSGAGKTMPPTVACNSATWIKFANLAPVCAANAGLLNIPFGYVWGANGTSPSRLGVSGVGDLGQYTNFMIWINTSNTANGVNLATLFNKTFLAQVPPPTNVDPYLESDLGKITYTTIAQYDLNDDGLADFNAGGPDRAVFTGCKGLPVSGACANADFNSDGAINDKDLAFSNDLFTGPGIAFRWNLDWFESRWFDPTGYNDKQIINYCLGRTAFEKCGGSDFDGDRVVNASDLTTFNNGATPLDFNGDGIVNLQ